MGLRLNVDLDTNRGATKEAYIILETVRFNRVNTRVEYTTSFWLNKESAEAFQKKEIGGNLGSSEGMLQREVIYYKDDEDYEGTEITLPNFMMADIYKEKVIKEPLYEEKEVETEVPFVSFDDEGNEVIKKRKVTKLQKVKVGENKIVKKLFDTSVVSNIFEYTYVQLKKELSKYFPEEKLEIVK